MIPGQCNSLCVTSFNITTHLLESTLHCCTFCFIRSKFIEFQEELWDVTTMKNEVKDEVITGDCGVLQER